MTGKPAEGDLGSAVSAAASSAMPAMPVLVEAAQTEAVRGGNRRLKTNVKLQRKKAEEPKETKGQEPAPVAEEPNKAGNETRGPLFSSISSEISRFIKLSPT